MTRGTIVFDGSALAALPWTGVARSFLTTLAAYVEVARRELVVLVPPGTPELGVGNVRRIEVELRGARRHFLLPSLLRRLSATVLHSPVAALPLRAPCPTIATIHDLPWLAPVRLREPGMGIRDRAAVAHATRSATLVLVPSRRTASMLRAPRVLVVPHGLTPPAEPAPADALRGPFLAIGDRWPRKNLDRVREAHKMASALHDGLPGLRVIGPLAGWVDEEEKRRTLRSARGLVHASLFEGFGLPVLEAMAHGVPVLASGDPALVELAAGAALHVDALSVEALARGLVRLHADADLRSRLRATGLVRSAQFTPMRSALLWRDAHELATAAAPDSRSRPAP